MPTELAEPVAHEQNGAAPPPPDAPPPPRTLEDTGLSAAFIEGLLLKALYAEGARAGERMAERLALPFPILDGCLLALQHRKLVGVRATEGPNRGLYVFEATSEGRQRARELLRANGYVGPAPVPRALYRAWVQRQSVRAAPLTRAQIHEGLSHMVLDEGFIDRLGPGINSGRSVFLYGEPGNGKTEVAFAVSRIMGSSVWVPYAVEAGGQIIRVHDPHVHESMEPEAPPEISSLLLDQRRHDRRFARVRRPSVVVGGELTLDDLELRAASEPGVFVAPPQMKANGGVFVIDDFGRQRVRPRDLLNRWMIPLDRGCDYLRLPDGDKLEIPFDVLVFFATNLDPADLVEEAFLRRIRYKIPMPDPTRAQYAEILRRVCRSRGIEYTDFAVELVFDGFYAEHRIAPRSCHPGDLVSVLCDAAHYRDVEPALTPAQVQDACRSYFLEAPPSASGRRREGNHRA